MTFVMTSPVRMTSQLLLAAASCERDCSQYVLQQHQATDMVVFFIRLPQSGFYKFQVYQPLSLLDYRYEFLTLS